MTKTPSGGAKSSETRTQTPTSQSADGIDRSRRAFLRFTAAWALLVAIICVVPALLLELGFDMSSVGDAGLATAAGSTSSAEAYGHLNGHLIQALLEWTAVCAASFVCLLCFVQYRLTSEPSLPVIGVAMICAGVMDAYHALSACGLIESAAAAHDLAPFTWGVCRLFNASVLLMGVGFFSFGRVWASKPRQTETLVAMMSVLIIAAAYLTVRWCATLDTVPRTIFPEQLIKRPYDVYPLAVYLLCGLVVFPRYLKRRRSLFAYSLIVSLIPQIATQLYIAFGSEVLHDSHFNVAHGLKAGAYLVPVIGLLSEYVHSDRLRFLAERKLAGLSSIVESSEDAIIGTDLDGLITSWNKGAEQLFRMEAKTCLGKSFSSLFSPQRRDTITLLCEKANRGERTDHFETVLQCGDGSHVHVSLNISPTRDAQGTITGSSAIGRDMTDRIRYLKDLEAVRDRLEHQALELEAQRGDLTRAHEEAQTASKSKSEFLANMSHEIRTPMTAILGYTDLLIEENWGRQSSLDYLAIIKRNGDHLLEIINDILDVSKIEAGKLKMERVRFSPNRLVAEIASLMRVRADAAGLELKILYQGPLPETIESDPTRLRQILVNLIGNAIKFTKSGSVQIRTRCVGRDRPQPMIEFDVTDTGIGMTSQQLERLFRPFTQADTSTTRKYGGTGLGLTICKRLAEILGGTISAQGAPGRGSMFRVRVATGSLEGVKLVMGPSEAIVDEGKPLPAEVKQTRLDCRVLLAEDAPANQRLIRVLLEKAGARVTVAGDGQQAFETAMNAAAGRNRRQDDPSGPFDVILMDMQMPVLDGYQATAKLREAGYTGPIIALTAHAMSGDRKKCLDAGCDDYANKPIDRVKLIELLSHYAQQGQLPVATPDSGRQSQ